jgi:mRNA-degrading endonuclease RelE of RelBE toxin-antitoxin system
MENLILEHRKAVVNNIQKSFEGDIEKAHVAGDTKVVNGKTLVYTEYAPNKFDWRVIKKKEGEKENIDEKYGVEKNTSSSYKQFKYFMPYPDNEDDLVKIIGASVKITEFDDVKLSVSDKKIGKVVGDMIYFNKYTDVDGKTKSDFDKKYEKLSSEAKREVNSVIKNVLDKVGKSGVNPEDVRLEKNDNGSWRLKRLDGRVISNISKHFISEKNARLVGWYI